METQPYVVTTAHRGVFFGYAAPMNGRVNAEVRLERARMCVSWPQEVHGVLGLASQGPLRGSKVGPAVPVLYLRDVTAAMEMTPAAVKQWESEPWS